VSSPTSRNSDAAPGEALSAGIAGVNPETARENWAEESRHALPEPGAYEWWYFHALSPTGDGLAFSLFEGLPFHPKYLTQVNRYIHRLRASRKPWPALQASRYPAAHLAVFQKGKRVAQFLNLYPPESSVGTTSEIRIGPNRITLRQDGSFGMVARGYPYELKRGRPHKRNDLLLTADLTFTPTFPGIAHTRPFRAPDRMGAAHHWVLAAPHGRMNGSLQLLDRSENQSLLEMNVDTLGYHDHVYGSGGLATGVKTLLWGFIQGETWTAAWHQTLSGAVTPDHADGFVFFEKNRKPLVIDAPETRLSKSSFSNWLLRHPGRITMHGSDSYGHPIELLLTHNKVLDTAPFHTYLSAQGSVMLPGGRGNARGLLVGQGATHVLRLRRLRWPILSDLTLLAITPVVRDDPIWSA
jgi:carotenoid 1,2-hydratase